MALILLSWRNILFVSQVFFIYRFVATILVCIYTDTAILTFEWVLFLGRNTCYFSDAMARVHAYSSSVASSSLHIYTVNVGGHISSPVIFIYKRSFNPAVMVTFSGVFFCHI